MAISRLATSNPASNTDILLYTGNRTILSSVIATNKSSDAATIRVWVVPLDQDAVADDPLKLIAEEVMDQIKLGDIQLAHERCEGLNQKDKFGVWSLLKAKTKQALKKYLKA